MKLTIETPKPGEEDEIIIRCKNPDEELLRLAGQLVCQKSKITARQGKNIIQLAPNDVYYFEAVDSKVFAYLEKQVFEVRQKLYEIENDLNEWDFIRISKSVVLNMAKISYIAPMFNGRLEANLKNGEKVIISRQYVPALKKKLNIQ